LALAEGRIVSAPDVLADPRVHFPDEFRERLAGLGHRAVLAVPLQARGRRVGVLLVVDRTAREFTPEEVALAQAFADQAALALDNARLHEEVEQRRREADVLAELARSIGSALDMDTVLRRVAEGARELCRADLARVALLDPAAAAMVFRQWVGSRFPHYDRVRVAPGQGLGGLAWRTGAAVRTENYLEDPRTTPEFCEIARAEGVVAELVVPIRVGERVEGLLYVDRRTPRPFTDRDEAVLRRLTEHAGVAIQNARLYQGLERHSARLRVLARVNAMVSSSLDTAEVLRGIARAASELMDGAFVLFWVADEQARTLHRGAVSDEAVAADFPLEQLPFGEGASGWVAAHRAPLTIPDVSADPRYRAGAWAARHGLTSYAGVPLVFQDTLLGVLTVSSQTPRAWTDDEADLLGAFAAQAAVALQHARLHAETRRRLEETQALLDVASLLNATLDSRELLKRVALKIAHVCGVDRCTIERWEGGRVIPLMSQFADGHHDPAMWAAFRAVTPYDPAAVPAHARALATRRPVVIADATTSAELPREWVETYGIKSYLVVPLVRQDRVIGVMNLDYCRAVTPFEPWQVRLAEAIGSQLALALENTRLYAEAQERLRETTTLLRVGQILSHPVPVAEALRRVAREVALALEADTVGAYTADAARQTLSPLAGYRVPAPLREWFRTHPLVLARMGRLAENWRAGRPTASPDAQGDPGLDREWARALPAFSTLVVPTRVRGESVGAFCVVWWRTGRDVTPAEVRLVEGVAAQVGLALENAELARQRELRLRETEVLLEATRTIASTLEPSRLLRQLMRQFLRITGADTVGMWTLDERGTWLTPWQGYRVPREWLPVLRGLRLAVADLPLYAQAIATGRAAWIADALAEPRLPATLTARTPHRGHLFVPVRAKDRPVGAFIAVWRTASREFTQRELELLESLGQQAGVALENAWLFEQNRRQVDELTVLHELSRAMTGQLDRGTLLDALRQQLPRVLSVDRVVVLLLDEATGELEVALRLREGAVNRDPPLRYPRGVGLAGVVLSTGRPLRTDDYAGECARLGVAQPGPDWPAVWLGVPLVAGGHVMGVLALMRDQRPFTEAEERLAMSIADLTALALRSAQLYEERTRAYQELQATQDQLVRTEKLRALGEMASGVAHDFNNLLAAILGRTQLLLRHVQEPRLRQWLQVVERSALDGAQTVRRLQDFARVRRDTPMIPVDLNAVVRDALEITQSRWREEALRRGVVIRVDARLGPVPPVAGDPAELREALTNLILNAVDAMPQGGTLRLTTTPAEGAAVEVAVSDTGVGIPAAIRDRIFDPFFTTKGPQGTGLGLSMTYGIVVRHGGHISVESEEGQGSTFRLRFPALTDPPPAAGPRGVAEEAVEAGLRCLVVDDEEEVGRALGDVLEALGHHAAVVTAGARALEYLTMEPVDVVFTDLAMPEVSGWQVARAIRERWPHIPVFLVTGFGVELSAEERQAHGVAAVYAKPLSLDDITEALARARQARKAPRPREEP
jgi:GAF domain-containing protein/CheY-like chemotaxis protein